ncbi:NAD(P)/FAD-dependent oxidoreductase [Candidatus Giovannonibacteria bacterium]|nr:NAD(P)/FAD-dependent oxidoreductase [Candidatus Giovannonibacteria bacterium]
MPNQIKPDPTKPEILILGGGFGGVRAALRLARKLPSSKITVVDKRKYHGYYPDLYELAAAVFPKKNNLGKKDFLKLKSTVALPFKYIFSGFPNIKFVEGTVLDIDFEAGKVFLENNEALSYNFLILALGSETNFFNIPHLGEKAHELKNTTDALNIRSAFEEILDTRGKNTIISVIIAGGGFTGCELAGELARSLNAFARIYNHPRENFSITMIEGSSVLLGPTDPWIQKKAKERLEDLGAIIKLNSFIVDVKGDKIVLKDGSEIRFDLLIWTAGVRPNQLLENIKVKLEKNGCVGTDKNLRALPFKNVFAIGDMCFSKNPETGKPLPMTAQVAMLEADYIGKYISKMVSGKNYKDFEPTVGRFIIPLGGKYALADLGIMKISGFLPWFLKRIVALKYFASIMPFGRAFKIWKRGLGIFIAND